MPARSCPAELSHRPTHRRLAKIAATHRFAVTRLHTSCVHENRNFATEALAGRPDMSAPTDRPNDPNLGARGEWLPRVSEAASGLAARPPLEQPRGNSNGSTITVSYTSLPPSRHKSLDPTFLF